MLQELLKSGTESLTDAGLATYRLDLALSCLYQQVENLFDTANFLDRQEAATELLLAAKYAEDAQKAGSLAKEVHAALLTWLSYEQPDSTALKAAEDKEEL